MALIFEDTSPEVEELYLNLLRQAPAWRKLAMVGQMNETVRTLALAGLQQRYPEASPALLRRHLADLLLGPALAEQVYGQISMIEKA
jgi:hypothetical protein